MSLYGINRRLEAQKRIGFEMNNVGNIDIGFKKAEEMKESGTFYQWYPMEFTQYHLGTDCRLSPNLVWLIRYTNRPVSPRLKHFGKFTYNYTPDNGLYTKDNDGNYIILQK